MRTLTATALAGLLAAAVALPASAACTSDNKQRTVHAPAPITTPAPAPKVPG